MANLFANNGKKRENDEVFSKNAGDILGTNIAIIFAKLAQAQERNGKYNRLMWDAHTEKEEQKRGTTGGSS